MEVTRTRTTKLFDYYCYSQSPYLNANKLFLLQKLNQYCPNTTKLYYIELLFQPLSGHSQVHNWS